MYIFIYKYIYIYIQSKSNDFIADNMVNVYKKTEKLSIQSNVLNK